MECSKIYGSSDSSINKQAPQSTQVTDFAARSPFVSVFGDQVVGTRQNNINVPFIRNNANESAIPDLNNTVFTTSGTGGQEHENETAYLYTDTGICEHEIKSKKTNRYITGHGNDDFETMVFDGNESGVDSWVGYGSMLGTDFIGFGYQGTQFGIWLRLRSVDTFIPQEQWNENTLLDGDFIIDPSKENIQYKAFGWLGVADIVFAVNASKDDWIIVHRHQTANKDTKPHMSDPRQPVSMGIRRTAGSGSNIRVGSSSWYAGTVGERAAGTGADKFPFLERVGIPVSSNTETVLITLRGRDLFAGKKNTATFRYGTITLTSEGNKTVSFRVYKNGVTYNPATQVWDEYDTEGSAVEVNTDAPLNITTRTVGGITVRNEQIGGTFLQKQDDTRINLFGSDIAIGGGAGDIITITAISANATVIDILLRWIEEF